MNLKLLERQKHSFYKLLKIDKDIMYGNRISAVFDFWTNFTEQRLRRTEDVNHLKRFLRDAENELRIVDEKAKDLLVQFDVKNSLVNYRALMLLKKFLNKVIKKIKVVLHNQIDLMLHVPKKAIKPKTKKGKGDKSEQIESKTKKEQEEKIVERKTEKKEKAKKKKIKKKSNLPEEEVYKQKDKNNDDE